MLMALEKSSVLPFTSETRLGTKEGEPKYSPSCPQPWCGDVQMEMSACGCLPSHHFEWLSRQEKLLQEKLTREWDTKEAVCKGVRWPTAIWVC